MPTDVEVCQTNPAAFFSFGPYAWQPFGVLIQNRSNIAFYANEGTYCDETNYRFVVPPYYQGAFLVSGNQISFKFDKNGTLGPIPALERATVFITDTFVSPGLFPFAATVRDTLNSQQPSVGIISGTGNNQTATYPTIQPGLYEVYGWGATAYDINGFDGDSVSARFTLSLQGIGNLDVGWGATGGRQRGALVYNASAFGTGNIATAGVGPSYTLNGANLVASSTYDIYGWSAYIEDTGGTAGDGKQAVAQLNHNGTGSLGLLDGGIIANGGIIAAGSRVAPISILKDFVRPLRVVTPANVTNFQIVITAPGAAFTSSQSVQGFIRFSQVLGAGASTAFSEKNPVGTFERVFSPPLLVQVPQGSTSAFQIIAQMIQVIPVGSWGLDAVVYYAPLRF